MDNPVIRFIFPIPPPLLPELWLRMTLDAHLAEYDIAKWPYFVARKSWVDSGIAITIRLCNNREQLMIVRHLVPADVRDEYFYGETAALIDISHEEE